VEWLSPVFTGAALIIVVVFAGFGAGELVSLQHHAGTSFVGQGFDHLEPGGAARREDRGRDADDDGGYRHGERHRAREVEAHAGQDVVQTAKLHEADQGAGGDPYRRPGDRDHQALVEHRRADLPARGAECAQHADPRVRSITDIARVLITPRRLTTIAMMTIA
jgi:hypothetical protein